MRQDMNAQGEKSQPMEVDPGNAPDADTSHVVEPYPCPGANTLPSEGEQAMDTDSPACNTAAASSEADTTMNKLLGTVESRMRDQSAGEQATGNVGWRHDLTEGKSSVGSAANSTAGVPIVDHDDPQQPAATSTHLTPTTSCQASGITPTTYIHTCRVIGSAATSVSAANSTAVIPSVVHDNQPRQPAAASTHITPTTSCQAPVIGSNTASNVRADHDYDKHKQVDPTGRPPTSYAAAASSPKCAGPSPPGWQGSQSRQQSAPQPQHQHATAGAWGTSHYGRQQSKETVDTVATLIHGDTNSAANKPYAGRYSGESKQPEPARSSYHKEQEKVPMQAQIQYGNNPHGSQQGSQVGSCTNVAPIQEQHQAKQSHSGGQMYSGPSYGPQSQGYSYTSQKTHEHQMQAAQGQSSHQREAHQAADPESLVAELPQVADYPSSHVLYCVPYIAGQTPQPWPQQWSDGEGPPGTSVKMPCSSKIKQYDSKNNHKVRWDIIREALLQHRIPTLFDLHQAIASYNHPHGADWSLTLLREYFQKFDSYRIYFFGSLLPRIIKLALQLPAIVTRPVPLLKAGAAASLSLSQLQIASLLANAFLCTFPHRNAGYLESDLPAINFDILFNVEMRGASKNSVFQKLRCILHYFDRVTSTKPTGVVTFARRCMPQQTLDKTIAASLKSSHLRNVDIFDVGVIEDTKDSALQVDFANKVVGGGVLGRGCVQEEIRFVICPELIVSRLFTETLGDTEALVVTGAEQYSEYRGYADSFEWLGDHRDTTPRDESGRRRCSIVAMDAVRFSEPKLQISRFNVYRELGKAFVAFYNPEYEAQGGKLQPVATGNWGCGVFGGDPKLKFVIQVLAASACGRDVKYFVPGNPALKNDLTNVVNKFMQGESRQPSLDKILKQLLQRCGALEKRSRYSMQDLFKDY